MTDPASDAIETIRPGDDGFEEAVTGYQLGWPHRPDVILRPADRDQLAAAVASAGAGPLAVQRSGHGRRTPLAGGVLIDTSRLDSVRVDPEERTATVAAGATWADVIEAASPHGLAPLSGSSPGVGVVGYLRGGGLAILGRRFGWARDHARVTDTVEGPDGQITAEVEVDLFPVASVRGGSLAFDTDRIADALAAFAELTPDASDDLASSIGVVPMPPLDAVPEPIRGKRVAMVRLVAAGEAGDTGEVDRAAAAYTERLGEPLLGGIKDWPYAEATTIFNDPPTPHAFLGTNVIVSELSDAVRRALVDEATKTVVQVNHLGGALSDGNQYLIRLLAGLHVLPEDEARAVQQRILAVAEPWAVGRVDGFLLGRQLDDLDDREA